MQYLASCLKSHKVAVLFRSSVSFSSRWPLCAGYLGNLSDDLDPYFPKPAGEGPWGLRTWTESKSQGVWLPLMLCLLLPGPVTAEGWGSGNLQRKWERRLLSWTMTMKPRPDRWQQRASHPNHGRGRCCFSSNTNIQVNISKGSVPSHHSECLRKEKVGPENMSQVVGCASQRP